MQNCIQKKTLFLFFYISILLLPFTNQATKTIAFNPPEIILLPSKIEQGETVCIYIIKSEADKITNISGNFGDMKIVFSEKNDLFFAIIGIPLKIETGQYNLDLNITLKNGLFWGHSKKYNIEPKKIKIESFSVKEKKISSITNEDYINERKFIDSTVTIKDIVDPNWNGIFIIPAEAGISSPFAALRNINNGKLKFYHYGVDIAAFLGADVKAANNGIVKKVEELVVRGKTVMIEHGAGIFTMYNHMSSVNVIPGQKVKKGDIIGKVGNSGLSSGAHLHWQLFVNGVSVNPITWTDSIFFDSVFSKIIE